MIELITGGLGSGKSLKAIMLMDEAFRKGKVVVSNVLLLEGWERVLARRHVTFWWARRETVEAREDQYLRSYHYVKDLDELQRIRLRGKGEERGVVILDECHRWMNSRAWDADDNVAAGGAAAKRSAAIAKRLKIVGWISAIRHYGFKCYLLTQSHDNIDNQVRGMFEHHTKLLNLKNIEVLGFRIIPFNLFLSKTTWRDDAKTKMGTRLYGLDSELRRLYDTHALQKDDWPEDVILLPVQAESARDASEASSGRSLPTSERELA